MSSSDVSGTSCSQNGSEPLMYSQFCYYIQQDEQRRRAAMHLGFDLYFVSQLCKCKNSQQRTLLCWLSFFDALNEGRKSTKTDTFENYFR